MERFYILNDKSMTVPIRTEVEQTELALGKKRQRDMPNVSVDSIKSVNDATRDVERRPVVKRMKTRAPAPVPILPSAPAILSNAELQPDHYYTNQ